MIAGSFDALAELLRRKSYRVEVTPTLNYTLAQQAAAFDLLLLDEGGSRLWARESARRGKVIIVFHDEPPEASVRIAMEAGAKSCVCKLWDEDRIIAELAKVRRYSGVETNGARVLIVDNTAVQQPLKESLTDLGYQVHTASDYEAALAAIDEYEPHVVITDITLDIEYASDDSGLRLAQTIQHLYADTVKVVLLVSAPIPIGRTLEGIKLVFRDPDGGVEELNDRITESIKELNLNLSLAVEFDPPLSWKLLADLIQRKVRKPSGLIVVGLKDVIGKLFHDKRKVKACHAMDSDGGNGALLISPIQQKATEDYFLVRFGERKAIQAETDTFKLFVAPLLKGPIVDLLSEVRTMRLGGLKFSFSRGFDDRPRDFATFYRNTTENELVCAAIEKLTGMLSEPEYQQRTHEDSEAHRLIESYKETLNDSFQLEVLVREVDRLLSGEENFGVRFRKRRSGVEVTIDGKTHNYPNPLKFVKNLHPESVPIPRAWCVTNAGFTARNLFVDAGDSIWLTDFHYTKPGPILRDFSHLEAIIKFELIEQENFADLFAFEKSLLTPDKLSDAIRLSGGIETNPEFAKARSLITKIRTLAQQQYRQDNIKELYVCLLFRTLRMMTWKGITSAERDRYPVRLRYAFLSSTMIAHRLQKNFTGWGETFIV